MTNDTNTPFQELADASQVETQLRKRIEQQRTAISIALAYIRSGRPEIAELILANETQPPEDRNRKVSDIMAKFDAVVGELKSERGEG